MKSCFDVANCCCARRISALRANVALAAMSAPGGAPLPEAVYLASAALTSSGMVPPPPSVLGGVPPGSAQALRPSLAAVPAAQGVSLGGARSGSPRSPQEAGLGSVGLAPGGLPHGLPPGVHLGVPPGGVPAGYPQGMLGMPAGVSGAPNMGGVLGAQQRLWQAGGEGGGPVGVPGSPSMMYGVSVSELKRLIEARLDARALLSSYLLPVDLI